MTIDELLTEIQARSIRLRRNGDRLTLVAAQAALDPSFVEEVQAHKAVLLALIDGGKERWWPPPLISPDMLTLVELTQEEIDRVVSSIPGGAENVQDIYPLAPLQEGILFHHLMRGEGDPYLLGSLTSFEKRAKLDKYLEAVQCVIDRHDILRTGVVWEGLREPVQVVYRRARLAVEEVELDSSEGDIAERLYERFDPRRYRMDVRQAPLLRAFMAYDQHNERWLLMMLRHHLTGDHTTLEVMQEEIQAHLMGAAGRLPVPLPFRNLVAQAQLGVSREEHEAFFRELLGDVEEPTAPFGLLNVQGDGTGIEESRIMLDSAFARRLQAQARKLGVSAASVCHVAWAQVLGRVSGREDVVFGTVLFGRMQGGVGADRVMGLFINTLPVRIHVGERGAEEAVRRMHAELAELLRHEHASLALAQRCSGVPAPAPLFSALLNYRHSGDVAQATTPEALQAWEGMKWLRGEERTNYPVTLSVDDFGERFGLTVQTLASIRPKRVCEYMRTAMEGLVAALEKEPGKALRRLQVLPKEERELVLHKWNETKVEYPREKCIQELFEEQVEKSPEATAVVFGDRQLSYGELNRRANQLAHYLRELGVKPDERVGICVERGFEMIVGLLAVLKAGGAYVPLDPAYPVERLRYMLEDSGPVALLTQGHLQGLFPELRAGLRVIHLAAETSPWNRQPETNPDRGSVGLTPEHLVYVIYTSGSTGTPKGVMVEHKHLTNLIRWHWDTFALGPGHQSSSVAGFGFDAAAWEVWPTLCVGAVLILASSADAADPERLLAWWESQNLDVSFLPTPIAEIAFTRGITKVQLRTLLIGGDHLRQRPHKPLPFSLINNYGPTEATVVASSGEVVESALVLSIGRPIANTRIYILDEYGEPVPVGAAGELYIGGAGVARGYLNRMELTAERFLKDPFVGEPGARMYKTGDVGRWLADGNIEFLGRNDEQVKIRGLRIELGEVGATLASHAAVREAVVVVREDEPGEKQLVAYYTSSNEQKIGVEELRSHLSSKLPQYMVPAAYVRLERMPLTANGKLDRKRLPAPEGDACAVKEYEAPQGGIEEKLAGIWEEVLKVERVGRQDNFFELGGHSLLAVRMVSRIRQALGVEAAIGDLFRHSILSDFARNLEGAVQTGLPPITLGERGERLALSYAQQRLWFLAQMEGGSEAYHIALGLRLKGKVNHQVLRQALDRIVVRHEVLRTRFISADGEAVQMVASVEGSHFHLVEHDLRRHSDVRGELDRLVAEEARNSFDLESGPLIRGRLIRLTEDEHALLITMHHIVSDGWSMGVMLNELSVLYGVFLRGEEDPLPELSVQYADYAAWQRKWIDGGILWKQVEYWKETLAGTPAVLELPADHVRPAEQDYAGGATGLELDAELTAALKDLSKRHGVTLYMTLLAGWGALLGRLSGQEDVVIGSPVANRGRSEVEGLIGFFVNTLAIRLDLGGTPTVGELLQRVKGQSLAAQEHQDIPFEQVVEQARPVRSLSHSPVFQVMFAWQNALEGSLELSGLEIKPLQSAPHVVAKFDLTLSLQEAGERIVGGVEYATSLFEESSIQRYLGYFRRLLAGMVGDDKQVVDRLPILGEGERELVLHKWNETKVEYPREKCIQELFEEQVEKSPEATAVVFGDRQLSYGELNRRANQLAHYLRELGVKPDERVGICVERGFEMIVGLLAVLKAGGAYVPLDPAYPVERLRYMLEDSGPVALLTQGHLRKFFGGISEHLLVVDLADTVVWGNQPGSDPECVAIELMPEHLAYIIYTSGSAGTPKGVMVEHTNVTRLFSATDAWFQFSGDDVWTLFHSYAFDFSVWEIWGALLYGGRLIIVPKGIVHSPEDFYRLVCREKVTILNQTPSAFRQLIAAQAKSEELHQLRQVIFGGEALEVATLKPWYEQNRGRGQLVNMYGITETTVHVTYRPLEPVDIELCGDSPIGCRIPDLQIYILDRYGEPVPVGVRGELYIGGAGVARGYLKRPELTAERFVADPFSRVPGARMYKTGDVGRWLADGNIEFLGRNDEQVKIRGFRIELGEIEARLAEHPGVREAVVVAREDTPGEKRLVGYYTAADQELSVESLRSHLATALPEYMVPAAYVRLERLPLTPNGKLDRKALPAPDGAAFTSRSYEPPQGETETAIANIWVELLHVDRVGRHDNFFELGGHSLLAVTLIERMRGRNLLLDVRTLFATSTLAVLAATVRVQSGLVEVPPNRIPVGCEVITPEMLPLVSLTQEEIDRIVDSVSGGARNVKDVYPLAPLQEGIFFHHLMAGEGDPYLLGILYSFDSRARLDSYLVAQQAVIDRHDILRTAVMWEGLSEPVQVVQRRAKLPVEEVLLDTAAGDVVEQLYEAFNPRHYRIDVRQAPLMRCYIANDAANGRWLLMLLLHHLAGDHTTLEVRQQEMQAYLLGQVDRLDEPQPFRNLVAQARLGISREEHEAFFRKMLGDVEEPTAPFGLMEVHRDGTGVERARLKLEPGLARRIREQARKLRVSAASVCHLAWAQVLAKVSGRKDVVFGTVLFGRMGGGAAADRVMGLFVNTLPVRIQVGEEGVEASMRRTHRLLADLLRHEHASLVLVQRCSQVPAPAPLFSALLNYRHSTSVVQAPSSEARRAWEGIQCLRGEERTNYPYTLSVDDLGEGFALTAQTVASIDPKHVCEYMHRALESLVAALETAPTTAMCALDVLPEEERRKVLYEWNDTRVEYPSDRCVHELFEQQVEQSPEAVAVVFEEEELSYSELNRRANQLAHHLRGLGVGPDDRVAICVERSFEMIVGLLAVLKAGGAYVPLDPAYPADRLRFMLEDSAPKVLLTQSGLRSLLPESLAAVELDNGGSVWSHCPSSNPGAAEVGLTPQHLAYVIYTSGSTGLPKGVMVEHRGLCNLVVAQINAFGIGSGSRILQFSSFSFDACVSEIFTALCCGGLLCIYVREAVMGNSLMKALDDNGITHVTFPPAVLATLPEDTRLATLTLIVAGDRLEDALVRRWKDKVQLLNAYGPTEATVCSTIDSCMHREFNGSSIGRPIANTQVYILDGHLQPVPVGVRGELYIGGAGVARGYLKRAELTAERFVADPFSRVPGARMYKTGDVGRWLADGNIEFLGRNDEQVKIRGFRIELGEIEARLAEHPGVREAVVVAREDTPGEKRLVGYYTAADQELSVESLRNHLATALPEYMVPAAYVRLERLPLTPNGKLDRKALPAPDGAAFTSRSYEPPQGETETAIANIWVELLHVDRVGRHDNFFELGGHSLLAVRTMSSLCYSLNVEISIKDIFDHPTLINLSERVIKLRLQQFSPDQMDQIVKKMSNESFM